MSYSREQSRYRHGNNQFNNRSPGNSNNRYQNNSNIGEDGWGRKPSSNSDGHGYQNYYQRSPYSSNSNSYQSYRRGHVDQRYSLGSTNNSNTEIGHWTADRKRPPESSAATVTASNDNTYPPKKLKAPQSYCCDELTLEQQQYRSKLESQLQDGECIQLIPRQAFILPSAWDERKKRAAQVAMEYVLKELKKESDANAKGWSDEDDSYASDVSYVGNRQQPGTLTAMEKKYFEALPDCLRMMTGFDIDGDEKLCYCPCSRQNEKWRKQHGLEHLIDQDVLCSTFTVCEPLGLMSHLKKVGGVYEEKENRKMKKVPMICKFHYGANIFLRELYKDYNGDGIGHKALYYLNDDNYKKAERAVNLRKEREKQAIVKEKMELQKELSATEEKMLTLEKINSALYKKNKRLESEMEKLGIEQKERLELSAKEMQEWNDSINGHFTSLRNIFDTGTELEPIMPPIVISVERDVTGRNGFLLQPFLDNLYDEKRKPSIFNQQDFEICRKVLFGDILSPDEIERLKEKKREGKKPSKMKRFNITIALISKWNVIFNKTESYGRSKAAKELKELDTAIDEGGPSRQFFSDVWKQLHTLAVPVLKRKVQIFYQDKAIREEHGNPLELIPQRDDDLFKEIWKILEEHCDGSDAPEMEALLDDARTRIKLYARAIGRMMLHSFIHGYPVSSGVMTPFFMNLILRGIIPGDPRYDKGDIVKHMDGILCKSAEYALLSYKLEDGTEDKNGNALTKDTLFSDFIPAEFIHTRSQVLGALIDGMSLDGKKDASEKLQEGSQLCRILRPVPLEAISEILFARPNLTFEDVKEALEPVYCVLPRDVHNKPIWEGSEESLAAHKSEQKYFFETQFLSYIKDKSEKDSEFLSKFVECCTGSSCLPHKVVGDSFQIKVEFNLGIAADTLPKFHTCTKEIVFPGVIYERGADNFLEIIDSAIESSSNQFDMN